MAERLYVYAVTAATIRLPAGISGFGGPLYIIPYAELAAVVSGVHLTEARDSASAAPTATAENLLRHEAAVEDVRACGLALPVRFGTVLADSDEVMRALARHYDTLRNDLWRIGDKVEMGVSVLWHSAAEERADATPNDAATGAHTGADGEGANGRPGLAYLRARLVEYRRAESVRERAQTLAREVDIALRPHVLDWRRSLCPSERLALRDQYLLERERLGAFESAFDELRRRHEARFLLSGPWPPYSFVTPLKQRDKETLAPEQIGLDGSERASGALGR